MPVWEPKYDLDYVLVSELPEDEQRKYYKKNVG